SAPQGVDRQALLVQTGARRVVGGADVQGRRNGMVAHVWGVVARRAGADDDGLAEDVVEAADACDTDGLPVKDRLAPRDRLPRRRRGVGRGALEARPRVVERHRVRGEWCARRIEPQRVVDADVEGVVGQVQRTGTGSLRVQLSGRIITYL